MLPKIRVAYSGSGSGSSNNAPEWMVALFTAIPFILALSAIGITSFIFGILFVIEAFKDKNFMAEVILGILGLFVIMSLLLLIGATLALGK